MYITGSINKTEFIKKTVTLYNIDNIRRRIQVVMGVEF